MRQIYLVTTKHLENALWFRDDADFRVAMNYVAIQAASCPSVAVLAFILMSNHIHFVLTGTLETVISFINGFKQRYSLYYYRKYGIMELLRRNSLDVKPIPFRNESPERAIAYVQMNCVAANICVHPSQYPWGTGNSFFCINPGSGKRLGSLSDYSLKRLMHSEKVDLPADWFLNEQGFIPPPLYVDVKTVESLFRTPNRLIYFMNNSSKAQKRLELSGDNLPAFRDQTIIAALPDLCRSLFQKESFSQLDQDQKRELTRQVHFRFSADAHQIARVFGVSYAEVAGWMDSI